MATTDFKISPFYLTLGLAVSLGFIGILLGALILDNLMLKLAAIIIPFALFIGYLAIYQLKSLFWVTLFLLPVSVNLGNIGMGVGISVPGEILVGLIGILVLMNLLRRPFIQGKIWKHPVTIFIMLNFLWMTLTTITSSMPAISLKFMVIRFLFLLSFFLLATKIFQNPGDFRKGMYIYLLPLTGVIVYALIQHSAYNFHQQASFVVVEPFFNDHTVYGATLAFVLPVIASSLFLSSGRTYKIPKLFALLFCVILVIGILFSYSRAAWFSVFFIGLAVLLLWLKIPFRYILFGFGIVMAIGWVNRDDLLMQMKGNQNTRSSDFRKHLSSATNISTSVSNKERINRWKSGLKMFEDRPFWGFGPGTYMFQYGPYQFPQDLTRISSYHGERGGVHSEYLKPLVESGVIGFLTYIGMILAIGITGMRVIYNAQSREVRVTSMTALAGFVGYLAHGFVNYFSHTDKVAMLFWGFAAFLVVMDCQNKKHYDELKEAGRYKAAF